MLFFHWLCWLLAVFLQFIKQVVLELLTHSSSVAIMVKSERLWTTDRASNFSEVKQRSDMQVYSSRLPSLEPKTER